MTAQLIDGNALAKRIREDVAARVRALAARGTVPGLAVLLVGDDPASQVYVKHKVADCEGAGMRSLLERHPATLAEADLLARIRALNADPAVHGILVQLPLPPHIDAQRVIETISPAKDVDGFTVASAGALTIGRPGFRPCTPYGCMQMLASIGCDPRGRHAVVIGRSNIVGKPMAMMLLHAHSTVTLCHSRTRDLAAVTRQAEILVVAAGRLALVGAEHVAEGAVVVDVGVHRVEDRATVERLFPGNAKKLAAFASRGAVLAGDVDFTAVAPRAGRITPVPGGVGPLTIAMLMANAVRAARRRRGV